MFPKWGSVWVSSIEKSPKPKHLESNSCSFAQFDFSEVYSQGKSGLQDIFWCIEERTTLRSVKSVTPQQCVSGVEPPHRLLVGVGLGLGAGVQKLHQSGLESILLSPACWESMRLHVEVVDPLGGMLFLVLFFEVGLGSGSTATLWASGKNRPAPSALRPGGKSIFRPFSGKKGGKLWSSVLHRKRAENIPNSAL